MVDSHQSLPVKTSPSTVVGHHCDQAVTTDVPLLVRADVSARREIHDLTVNPRGDG